MSQGIKEDGIAIGEARGEARGEAKIIMNMYNNGLTAEQIAAVTDKDIEEVKTIIEEENLCLFRKFCYRKLRVFKFNNLKALVYIQIHKNYFLENCKILVTIYSA